MSEMRLIEAVRQGLREELAADSSVFLIGQDIGVNGGVFRVTDGLLDEFGPERVIDSPLAESGMVGVAIGAAMNGLRPVVEVQFADFIFPAFNQIVSEAARMYYRTNGDYSVPIVIRAPYGGGVRGGLYHSQSVEAYFAHVPGLKVVVPSNPHDAKGLLKSAIRCDDPVVFLQPASRGGEMGDVPDEETLIPLGKATVTKEGADVTLVAIAAMQRPALRAAAELAEEGIDVEVVDPRTVFPLDRAAILDSLKKTGRLVVADEARSAGSMANQIAAIAAGEGFRYLKAPVTCITTRDLPIAYSPPLETAMIPDAARIADGIRTIMKERAA